LFEDFGIADIPCVNNVFRSAQGIDRLGTQRPVGVRETPITIAFSMFPSTFSPASAYIQFQD